MWGDAMSIFAKFKESLSRTSRALREKIQAVFAPGRVSHELWDQLEESLIQADIGVEAASVLTERVRQQYAGSGPRSEDELFDCLAAHVKSIFDEVHEPLKVAQSGPTVYLLVGVNGSGKTTTAAKLAKLWKDRGKSVILAAADTFRAAAEDQLAIWAKRVGVPVISHQPGADPGAVAFDACKAALARGIDLVIVDTAGRLQTKKNLMEELRKIVRVVAREIPGAPHEVLLVVDGTTGQNGLSQARVFLEAAGVTGICLTKLDGSAKGGVAVAIARELRIPVKLVGIGEGLDDLKEFDSLAFSQGLFGRSH